MHCYYRCTARTLVHGSLSSKPQRRTTTTTKARSDNARSNTDKWAMVFPGQGSQYVGMGRDIIHFNPAKEVFNEAEQVLHINLRQIMFDGPEDVLRRTEIAQPAILTHSIAMLRVLTQEFGFNIHQCSYALGHSLGEYTALVASNSLSFPDALQLVRIRGKAMQDAVQGYPHATSMKAITVLGDNIPRIESIINNIKTTLKQDEYLSIGNINSRSQIVLSGTSSIVIQTINELKSLSLVGGRSTELRVTAPFHCGLMQNAEIVMKRAFQNVVFKDPSVMVVSNVTARPFPTTHSIPSLLLTQLSTTVQWHQSINHCHKSGVRNWVVFGPGKAISNLLKRDEVGRVWSCGDYGELMEFERCWRGDGSGGDIKK